MTDTSVLYETRDGIALITLNRPAQRNAINTGLSDQFRAAIERFETNPDLRVAVIAANGPVFCAGMDLKAFVAGEGDTILFGPGGLAGMVARPRRKPVIAAVDGAALAGGFEIVLACDMVVAGESATFGLPEARIGLVAGAGGALRLGARMPRVVANEMLLTGTSIGAARAMELGLLNRCVASGKALEAALELAAQIAANAPLSLEASLHLANLAEQRAEAAFWEENNCHLARLAASDDASEGIGAFIEKRAPRWSGS
jgi:enoyl-CoA hydratase/carnithine racemase